MSFLSDAERQYIEDGAEQGVRADGRDVLDVRPVTLETGVLPNASGSARVRIGKVTDILVGVKCEITEPTVRGGGSGNGTLGGGGDDGNEGRLSFSVECSSLASPEFVGRGAADLNAELTQYLTRLYSNDVTRKLRQSLCIIPQKKCWLLHVDALILASGGNLYGALTLAIRAALRVVVIPEVIIIPGEADEDDQVEMNEQNFQLLQHTESTPVAITLCAIRGTHYLADCTPQEEACADFILTVGVNPLRKVCAIVSSATSSLALASATNRIIDLDCLNRMIGDAVNIGVGMLKTIDNFLKRDIERRLCHDDDGERDDIVGFFG